MHSISLIIYPCYCLRRQINTYCVNKTGFQFFTSLTLFFLLSFSGHSLQCSRGFLFPFFLGRQRDLNQRSSLALAFLSLCHITRPRRFVEIYRIKKKLHVQIQIYITMQLKHVIMYIIHAFACNISTEKCIPSGYKKHAPFRNALFLYYNR